MGAPVRRVSTSEPLWGWWQELKLRSQRKEVADLIHQMNSSRPSGPETIAREPSPNHQNILNLLTVGCDL